VFGWVALGWLPDADACGLTPPIGPNGFPTVCHGDGLDLRLRAGFSVGGTATRIRFGDVGATTRQAASVATFDLSPLSGLTVSVAAGAALGGYVDYRGERYSIKPGALGGLGVSYRLVDGFGKKPFVQASFTVSLGRSTATSPTGEETSFQSKDTRVGLAIGKRFGPLAPFVVGRYFGGGTTWSVAGGHGADAFRYHVGAGLSAALGERFDSLLELAVVGEKRATFGIGYSF
jgi:hypothetical protein